MQLRTVPVFIDDTLLCGVTGETGLSWMVAITNDSQVTCLQDASSEFKTLRTFDDIENLFS